MLTLILKRLASVIPILFVVALVTFLLTTLAPGDPAVLLAGGNASDQEIGAVRERLGLNEPLWRQFTDYLNRLIHGDLGKSLFSGKPVTTIIWEALPATASIALVALTIAIVSSLLLGTWAAVRRGGIADRVVSAVSAFFLGIPAFVVGLVLVLVFAVNLGWLPATGYVEFKNGFVEWLKPLILPGIALALPLAAEITRQVRGALVDVLEQDYVRTQRAKGLPERTVVVKHAFKNALPPVITVVGLQMARLLSATIIVESVFGIGGLGQLTFTSVTQHDFPLIQGIALVSAVVVVMTSLVTDIATAAVNPRLRTAAS